MRFKRATYRISLYGGVKEVVGYAVAQSIVPVRIAVRCVVRGYWVCDHWDTGFRITTGTSKTNAAIDGLRLVNEKQRLGLYDAALVEARRHGHLIAAEAQCNSL